MRRATTTVEKWTQRSLFDRDAVQAITLSRWRRIQVRLQREAARAASRRG